MRTGLGVVLGVACAIGDYGERGEERDICVGGQGKTARERFLVGLWATRLDNTFGEEDASACIRVMLAYIISRQLVSK